MEPKATELWGILSVICACPVGSSGTLKELPCIGFKLVIILTVNAGRDDNIFSTYTDITVKCKQTHK